MILLIWLCCVFYVWWAFVAAVRSRLESGLFVLDTVVGALVLALPPTGVFLICSFVLLQAAPTAQFNAHSEWRMALWSYWSTAWRPLFHISAVLCVLYSLAAVILSTFKKRRLAALSLMALLASAVGWFVLAFAYPTA